MFVRRWIINKIVINVYNLNGYNHELFGKVGSQKSDTFDSETHIPVNWNSATNNYIQVNPNWSDINVRLLCFIPKLQTELSKKLKTTTKNYKVLFPASRCDVSAKRKVGLPTFTVYPKCTQPYKQEHNSVMVVLVYMI